MTSEVLIDGKRFRLDPSRAIGKGGEADIYLFDPTRALKVFKPPDHPDLEGQAAEQQAARERLVIHQEKLRVFPTALPPHVVAPEALASDRTGRRLVGYTMRYLAGAEVLLRYGERPFRSAGVPNDAVVQIFRDLHRSVIGLHAAQVVIGDFNDLNVMVLGTDAYLIDTDSFQFGKFPCSVFTAKFADPLLCDPRATSLLLAQPHTAQSDWYAYAVMLFQSLLFVDPYGGVYRPKDPAQRLPHAARPLHRITIFHPEVLCPKAAVPYGVLPDELLEQFHRMFVKDKRGEFPARLLDDLRWTKCLTCGTEHARPVCPVCRATAPAAIKETIVIRGQVTATEIFRARTGHILMAAWQEDRLRWLIHRNGTFRREDDSLVLAGELDPQLRYRLAGAATLIGKGSRVARLTPNQLPEQLIVDTFGTQPLFDGNDRTEHWLHGGQLLRRGTLGSEYVGDVLAGQTLFWTGEAFGFGFSRAGNLQTAFVFDAQHGGLNDEVKLPRVPGQLVDATCVFGRHRAWLFTTFRAGTRTMNRCVVIRRDGAIEATAEAPTGDGSWLGTFTGACPAGEALLMPTDAGLVRVEVDRGTLIVTREFPDTEPFVEASSQLVAGADGLYVIGEHAITRLTISA